ncbi:MAG: carbohydrate ABC transporter permease [Caldicoprobacterales bacterium]
MGKESINFDKKTREKIGKLFMTVIMFAIGIIMILPFVWMLSTSFKLEVDVFKFPIEWIPRRFTTKNYVEVWLNQNPPFYVYCLNSIKITVICVLGELATSSLAAYGFSRLNFKGRDSIFLMYLGTMMIPFQVLMVPRFMLFQWLGLYNTHWSLILPGMFTTLGVFLLRQYFLTIPMELSESARIDGAGEFRTFWQIILPLAKPALASLAILTFVWRWNDYEGPLVFLSNKNLYTIPLGLTNFIDEMGGQQNTLIMAASVSAIFPIIIVFLLGQKYFIEGITAGSIKG